MHGQGKLAVSGAAERGRAWSLGWVSRASWLPMGYKEGRKACHTLSGGFYSLRCPRWADNLFPRAVGR